MHRNEVAKLMDKIPQGLTPDEFLVALATHAAAYERKQCAAAIEQEVEKYDREYKEIGLELAQLVLNRSKQIGEKTK